ncbi:GntR family transcriptional regulator [Streptomyces sp. NPDC052013]|uniref:GntR family transcriptional regulator n=1 Tax=Streptomyces sp. NPDC052013 TaxID=3365679 RepID=UPI0037CD43E0
MSEERRGAGGGSEVDRVLTTLRERIDTHDYPVGGKLPTQRQLSTEFGVSRHTVQRALEKLIDDGLIESRQGSGSFVVGTVARAASPGPAVGPAPGKGMVQAWFIERAFRQREVELDVFTLTSESLDAHIRLQAERIRGDAMAPDRIRLRIMLPDEKMALPYPQNLADPSDARPQTRLHDISRQCMSQLKRALRDLRDDGVVPDVDIQVRRVPLAPTFKLYLSGGTEALYGPYEVVERVIRIGDTEDTDDSQEQINALDVLGINAILTHQVRDQDPDSAPSVFVESQQRWFTSVWDRLAVRDHTDPAP